MEKAAGGTLELRKDWKAIVGAQARSQQTAADFCRTHGVIYSTFLYHRGKILKKQGLALVAARLVGAVPVTPQRGFIPVRVEGSCGLRLRFPRGLVMESDRLPPAAWVAEVAARWIGDEEGSC